MAELPMRAFLAVTLLLLTSTATASEDVAALHDALLRNDRPAFDAQLPRVRDEGEAAMIYADIAKLWDAQFASPFFDESSEAYRIVSAYPGYGEAIRRHIFVDDAGRRFYPAAESREYLTSIAASRFGGALPRVAPVRARARKAKG